MNKINNRVVVRLAKSIIGRLPSHKATVNGLGLKRLNQVVVLEDTPSIRGMINKVSYMLEIKEA